MPNPHFRAEVYSRKGGRSVIAAASYRSGEVLTASPSVVSLAAYRSGEYLGDTARGETFDYRRKEGVEWTHIYTPANAPAWASDRQELWNRAELAETRKDARLARGIEASLPRLPNGIAMPVWQEMMGKLAEHFTRHGLAVDGAIHNVKARDGGDNPHIHLLIADRPLDADGFRASKTNVRFLNSKQALAEWRQAWETITNDALAAAGLPDRVSLQSYAARGIDREATKPLGPKANALEKRGIATPEGDENRAIRRRNAQREAEAALLALHEVQVASAGGTAPADHAIAAAQVEAKEAEAPATPSPNAEWWERYYQRIDALRRRHEQLERGGGRPPAVPRPFTPHWSDFSARVGGEVNAARDAVHRYRFKTGEAAESQETRWGLTAFAKLGAVKLGAVLRRIAAYGKELRMSDNRIARLFRSQEETTPQDVIQRNVAAAIASLETDVSQDYASHPVARQHTTGAQLARGLGQNPLFTRSPAGHEQGGGQSAGRESAPSTAPAQFSFQEPTPVNSRNAGAAVAALQGNDRQAVERIASNLQQNHETVGRKAPGQERAGEPGRASESAQARVIARFIQAQKAEQLKPRTQEKEQDHER